MNKIVPLTTQEENVMRTIWTLGNGATVRAILGSLSHPQPPYTTVASIVKNLQEKGYISAEKQGKSMSYRILIARSKYSTQSITRIVQDFFGGDYGQVVQFFAKKAKISPEELQEIVRQIEQNQ